MNLTDLPVVLQLEICEKLSFKELSILRSTNKCIMQNTQTIFRNKYESIVSEFLDYEIFFFENLMSNFLLLTVDMQARLYFEFLEQVLLMYTPVLVYENQVIENIFQYICIFYETLDEDERTYYKKLCLQEIARFLYINQEVTKLDREEKQVYIGVLYDLLDHEDKEKTNEYSVEEIDEALSNVFRFTRRRLE